MFQINTRKTLKNVAVIAMTVNHFASLFLHDGHLAMPIFSFLLADGFIRTRSRRKYGLRLFFWGIISNIAYWYCFESPIFFGSAIFTLWWSFLLLWVWESCLHQYQKILLLFIIPLVSFFGDWGFCSPVWTFLFYHHIKKPNTKNIVFLAAAGIGVVYILSIHYLFSAFLNFGFFIGLVLLYFSGNNIYIDKNLQFPPKWMKIAFYLYYPIHLVLLKLLAT